QRASAVREGLMPNGQTSIHFPADRWGVTCRTPSKSNGKQLQLALASLTSSRLRLSVCYCPNTIAKINGATIVASELIANLGVFSSNLPQVIFSVGFAPE